MRLSSAYLLVSHGSRDPRPQIAAERLASLLEQKLQATFDPLKTSQPVNPNLESATAVLSKPTASLVDTACLELAALPLSVRIERVTEKAQLLGLKRLEIVPLFLLPGVHVKEDIPREIAIAKEAIGNTIELRLRPYLGDLGSYPRLLPLLRKQLERLPAPVKILMSHGSRRPGGNIPCKEIAARLNAIPAYWSLSPTLAERIESLAKTDVKTIAILPYFLFNGGITDAIAQQIKQLQLAYPKLELLVGEPLGATDELADAIEEGINEWSE